MPSPNIDESSPDTTIDFSFWNEGFVGSKGWTGPQVNNQSTKTYDSTIPKVEYPANLTPCPIPEFKQLSDDPMDPNWGGEDYTEKSVKAGKYAGSELSR